MNYRDTHLRAHDVHEVDVVVFSQWEMHLTVHRYFRMHMHSECELQYVLRTCCLSIRMFYHRHVLLIIKMRHLICEAQFYHF